MQYMFYCIAKDSRDTCLLPMWQIYRVTKADQPINFSQSLK